MEPYLQKNISANSIPFRLSSLKSVTMSVMYKGLVLSEMIQPLHLGNDYGVFQAAGQNFLSGLKEVVYLHSADDPQTIRARIEEVNPKRAWVTLSHFTPLQTYWRERQEDRVQPSRPIHVRLSCTSQQLAGSLDNLSGQGLGVLVYHLRDKGLHAEKGTRVRVEIPVLNDLPLIKLDAVVQSKRYISTTQVILGLQVYPNRKQLLSLRQYIEFRKKEIFSELNTVKFARLDPRATKDLYF
jgi:hypothetical protein